MVPTQEERLPIRVSVSVRRLSSPFTHYSFILPFCPHAFAFTYDGHKTALNTTTSQLCPPKTIFCLVIEFDCVCLCPPSFYLRSTFLYVLRSIIDHVRVRRGYTMINGMVLRMTSCGCMCLSCTIESKDETMGQVPGRGEGRKHVYSRLTTAPCASNAFLIFSASSLGIPSLSIFGADSTNFLA
jgi:hypothetical protein